MTEYSRMAQGSFTATGPVAAATSGIVVLPFQPDYVELWNYTNIATPGANKVTRAWWNKGLIVANNNPTMVELTTSTGPTVSNFDVVANSASARGINPFAAGLDLQYGAQQAVSTITKASPAVVTSSAAHGLTSGDVVIFNNLTQTATTGMQQIAGIPFTVTVTSTTAFTIPWNTNQSNYTAYDTATATVDGYFVKVLNPYLYAPGVNIVSAITVGSTTTVDTTSAHNFVVGQEVAFRVPTVWGTTQLNSLPNVQIPGSPIYGYVVAVTDYNTFVVSINSSSYTAFNSNQPYSGYPGQTFAQVVAVGDVNTGGVQISAGSALYPPPFTRPIGTTTVNTINGPAIQGAFFNNTSQGFTIGAGVATTNGTATIMTTGDVIVWHAYLHDINQP